MSLKKNTCKLNKLNLISNKQIEKRIQNNNQINKTHLHNTVQYHYSTAILHKLWQLVLFILLIHLAKLSVRTSIEILLWLKAFAMWSSSFSLFVDGGRRREVLDIRQTSITSVMINQFLPHLVTGQKMFVSW